MDTKNWNHITVVMPDIQTLRNYDGLVGLTMLNIYSLSKENKTIRLYNFNFKNFEHLYLLRIALMARTVYDFDIEIEGSWWDVFKLNWKIRKGFEKVKRCKIKIGENDSNGINVPMILDFMRPDGIARLGKDFTFADIYHDYYEGSLN